MTFYEWVKEPFTWLHSGAAKASAPFAAFFRRPVVLLFLTSVLGGCTGGMVSRLPLPSVQIPWSFPLPSPTPAPTPPPLPDKGLHVLMLVDSATPSTLTADQQLALTSGAVRAYLNDHCPLGPDGHTHEWRLWDKSVDAANEEPVFQTALKRAEGKPMPWIIVSNGTTGYEGALPANADALLALLKKYGG